MITLNYLPYRFVPREYQWDVWRAFFKHKIKRFMDVEHRRAGKDKNWLNISIAASQMRVGTYMHTFPTLTLARRVIWNGIDHEGNRFLDHVPPELISSVNNQEMRVNLKNGSIYQLAGADQSKQSLVGTNPIHITFSEFSVQNPAAWDYLRPILTENQGSAAFIFTPRGENHAYKLYERVKDNSDWFSRILTVDDTRRSDGSPVMSPEQIEQERQSGMSDNMIDQEFYCSFTAAVPGAYFAVQLKRAEVDNRIIDFSIDSELPIETFWDLGIRDSTAIWCFQRHLNEIRAVACYENNNVSLDHYINWLHDFRNKHGIVFGNHYAPHDVMKRDLGTGKSLLKIASELGINFKVVPRIPAKMDAIEAARFIMGRVYFHKTNCQQGMAALREYHCDFNDLLQTYGDPVHNWASNLSDAFMQMAQVYVKDITERKTNQIFYNRVGRDPLG